MDRYIFFITIPDYRLPKMSKQWPRNRSAAKPRRPQKGLCHDRDVVTDRGMFLINKVNPCLGRDAALGIDAVCLIG